MEEIMKEAAEEIKEETAAAGLSLTLAIFAILTPSSKSISFTPEVILLKVEISCILRYSW